MLSPRELAMLAASAADDKRAFDIRIMDMRDVMGITDYFVICSGGSDRQVRRIHDAIVEKLSEHGVKPARSEGERSGRWILLDYLDLVVHIFREEERAFYDLEHLWQDAEYVEWSEPEPAST